jgi:hypothetical protein
MSSQRSNALCETLCWIVAWHLAGCSSNVFHAHGSTGGARGIGSPTDTGGQDVLPASGGVGANGGSAASSTAPVPATGGLIGYGGTQVAGSGHGMGGWLDGGRTAPQLAGGDLGAGGSLGRAGTGGTTTRSNDGSLGGSPTTGTCAQLGHDFCVSGCFEEHSLSVDATCNGGAWSCRPGYVLASSCPARACGVTPDACCDLMTGMVRRNLCTTDGYRDTCPDGCAETNYANAFCVPKTLGDIPCISLDRQPCTGPVEGCRDMSSGLVTCDCIGAAADSSVGTWYCSSYVGP